MVLHVTPDGRQEAMRIEPGQTMKDVISKIEKGAQFSPFDVRESLTNAVGLLNVNFGFVHQDVGFELMDIGRRDITKRNSIPLRSEAVSISIASQREVFPQ